MHAVLDYQPDALAPRAALLRIRQRAAGQALVVAPQWRVEAGAPGYQVHVPDFSRRVVRSFVISPQAAQQLAMLTPGQAAPELDPYLQKVLIDAGILQGTQAAPDELSAAQASFARHGYGVVADALHPYDVASVRRYVRHGVRTGRIPLGDAQVPKRYRAHNDPVLRWHQQRLVDMVSAVVGVAVKPSYVYLAAYKAGAVLHRHVDRAQCAYSLTIPVDYTPEPNLETAWPIRLGLAETEVLVYQSLGDALVYAGPRVVHFRERLPAGHLSTSLLLHYVAADFSGPLN